MTTVNEAINALPEIATELKKIQAEIIGKIQQLEDTITAGGTLPLTNDQQVALDGIKESLASLDAIVPDVVPPAA